MQDSDDVEVLAEGRDGLGANKEGSVATHVSVRSWDRRAVYTGAELEVRGQMCFVGFLGRVSKQMGPPRQDLCVQLGP